MSSSGAETNKAIAKEPGLDALAQETLSTVRSTIMVSYRFLDRALWKMPFSRNDALDLVGTDGKVVAYDPKAVLMRYETDSNESVRDFVHLICHCIFYHPFIGNDINPLVWDLACDIVVEDACLGIAGKRFPCKYDDKRRHVIAALSKKLGNLSSEKVYNHILSSGIDPKEADFLKALFIRDDHGLWYHDKLPIEDDDKQENKAQSEQDDPNEQVGGENEQESQTDELPQNGAYGNDESEIGEQEHPDYDDDFDEREDGADPQQVAQASPDSGGEFESPANNNADDGPDDSSKEEWEDISRQMKVDLETRSSQYGSDAGAMITNLRAANTRKADYRSFLRRFAQIDEEMSVNDEEFDLVYYTYGLRMFENMPLVEPLEYRESKKVREFVIAIDTSGSVEGALVQRFVEETYNILKSTESFFTKVNLRIMQCDARVQSDVSIKSAKDFERYMRNFEVRGFGGTDFRPVFARVDERIEQGEFENLRGLIYFTDGYGTYPTQPPPYETVFVFADSSFGGAGVPPWAMRLYLDTTQLKGDEQ